MISLEKIEYYKPHWHDEMLVFALVIEGSIYATIGCDSYRMRKGNILLIGTEDVHSFRKTDDENTILFLRFDCRLLEKEFPGITDWNLIGDPSVEESSKTDFDRLRTLMVETVLSNCVCGGEDTTAVSKLLNYCRDKFLSTNLLQRKQDVTKAQMETFQKLSSYIRKNYTEPVSLGDVAEFINYSFNHTSFIIKQITGMSFTDYLNHIRCLAAERMLVSTDKNITNIALDCGFNDGRALGRYFKNWYKLTPSEYREQNVERFPKAGLTAFDKIDLNNPEILRKVETFIRFEPHTIIFDLDNLPQGTAFHPPVLGQPEQCLNYDGCNAVPQMIEGILDERIKTLKLTDDAGSAVFHGDCGLATHRGIKKPVFYIFDFLSAIRSIILREDRIAAGICNEVVRIIIYPRLEGPANSGNEFVRFIFNSADDDYIIKHFVVDCDHGNPQRMWEQIDSPKELSPDLEQLFLSHSIPRLNLSIVKNQSSFELTERLPAEGAVMIEILRINPV